MISGRRWRRPSPNEPVTNLLFWTGTIGSADRRKGCTARNAGSARCGRVPFGAGALRHAEAAKANWKTDLESRMTGIAPDEDRATERPLITFFVMAYNQEQYIREAIEGAFSQSYSPLEIILSDDCSTDRTFEIMQEAAERYRGPHEIVLNRNPWNLGIGGHVNRVMELARGELIVAAAGDDISEPTRVAEIFLTWREAGFPVCCVYSGVKQLNVSDGVCRIDVPELKKWSSLKEMLSSEPRYPGCAAAWDRNLFSGFGPLVNGLVNEDSAIWFRAEIAGTILIVPKVLVTHRLHGNNAGVGGFSDALSGSEWISKMQAALERAIILTENHINDLDLRSQSVLSECERNYISTARNILTSRLKYQETTLRLVTSRGVKKMVALAQALLYAQNLRSVAILSKLFFPRCYRGVRKSIKTLRVMV